MYICEKHNSFTYKKINLNYVSNSFQRICRSLRIPFFAEKMGTLDDDMAQEGDIAELQENFNEVVEDTIRMDHLRLGSCHFDRSSNDEFSVEF